MEKTKDKPSVSKTILDYSNTIIYKITCNDAKVPDKYVGHTTDFVKRKYAHKHTTTNVKSDSYNLKLYVTIRENGGWSNWRMEIVGFYNCLDLHEAKIKEQEHFVVLNANLNSIEPVPTRNEKISHTIPINEPDKINLDKQYNLRKFNCKECNYTCSKLSEWTKHTLTGKHLGMENRSEKSPKKYFCVNCNKDYSVRSSLWYHAKKCIPKPTIEPKEFPMEIRYIELVNRLLNDNQRILSDNVELRNFIVDQSKIAADTMSKTIETIMTQNADTMSKAIECCNPINNLRFPEFL